MRLSLMQLKMHVRRLRHVCSLDYAHNLRNSEGARADDPSTVEIQGTAIVLMKACNDSRSGGHG